MDGPGQHAKMFGALKVQQGIHVEKLEMREQGEHDEHPKWSPTDKVENDNPKDGTDGTGRVGGDETFEEKENQLNCKG
jgi:hypothetical protein